ncbi:MAG: CvpA family protein [Clostridia bacterium]|nr:CvpA family protein [Clostridia bacterium]
MSWVWDLITVALFALMIFKAWKDGFFKTLINLVSWILALVLSVLLSTPIATWIFDTFIRTNLTTRIAEEFAKATDLSAFVQGWEETLAAFPETVRNFLGMESGSMLSGLDLTSTGEAVATQMVDTIIAPLAILLISLVCVTVLFVVLTFVLSIVANLVGKVCKLPVLRQVDRTLGLLLGLIKGVLAAAVFAFIVQALCSGNLIDGVLSTDVYNDTIVVSTVVNVLSVLSVQGVPLSDLTDFVAITNVLN